MPSAQTELGESLIPLKITLTIVFAYLSLLIFVDMCLKPIRVRVRLATVSEGQPLYVSAPCGRCYQCLQRKQNDYYIRSYYESLSTFEKGGFILLDTLTYSDEFLPHVSDYIPFRIPSELDFSCFNSDHFRLFVAALRSRLKRDGYDPSHSLRYFLCSEYGTSEGCTHRPHYHVLFYVLNTKISPIYLSSLISEYWKYGRTDGIMYRGREYVLQHCTFGYGFNSDLLGALRSCGYVSKYVTKDSAFERVIFERFTILENYLSRMTKDFDLPSLKRQMRQYLRISKGFGLSMLDYQSLDDIIKDNGIYLSDQRKVRRFYPLPSYYRRKLFFDVVRYVDNLGNDHIFYNRNSLGDRYFESVFQLSVDVMSDKVRNDVLSFRNVSSAYTTNMFNKISDISLDDNFYHRLSLYVLYIRGRYFTDYYDYIKNLDSDFLRCASLMRYKFEMVDVVKHFRGVDYIGDLKCLSDGRREGFELDPILADALDRQRSDLFSNLNLKSHVFVCDLEPYSCAEFEVFERFLRVYELLSYYFYVELDESFKRTVLLKRKLKPLCNYVRV